MAPPIIGVPADAPLPESTQHALESIAVAATALLATYAKQGPAGVEDLEIASTLQQIEARVAWINANDPKLNPPKAMSGS